VMRKNTEMGRSHLRSFMTRNRHDDDTSLWRLSLREGVDIDSIRPSPRPLRRLGWCVGRSGLVSAGASDDFSQSRNDSDDQADYAAGFRALRLGPDAHHKLI
jgi:hypothetical protein